MLDMSHMDKVRGCGLLDQRGGLDKGAQDGTGLLPSSRRLCCLSTLSTDLISHRDCTLVPRGTSQSLHWWLCMQVLELDTTEQYVTTEPGISTRALLDWLRAR